MNTREKIEQSALKLFVQKGVKETTVRDIAIAAKISEGAMYRHWRSKDELAEMLFHENYISFANELEVLLTSTNGIKKQISLMVNHFCAAFDNEPILYSYLLLSQHDELRRIKPNEINPIYVLKKMISEATSKKEMKEIESDLAVALIMGVVLETAKFIIYKRINSTMKNLSEQLTKACLNILEI